jgi:hypothetical protein
MVLLIPFGYVIEKSAPIRSHLLTPLFRTTARPVEYEPSHLLLILEIWLPMTTSALVRHFAQDPALLVHERRKAAERDGTLRYHQGYGTLMQTIDELAVFIFLDRIGIRFGGFRAVLRGADNKFG